MWLKVPLKRRFVILGLTAVLLFSGVSFGQSALSLEDEGPPRYSVPLDHLEIPQDEIFLDPNMCTGTLLGMVKDENGTPVDHIRVSTYARDETTVHDGNLYAQALTEEGGYELKIGAGEYLVTAVDEVNPQKHLPAYRDGVEVKCDKEETVDFVLPGPTPQLLPDEFNCSDTSGIKGWQSWANQIIWNPDCSDYSLIDQVVAGCDPLDPTSNPSNPDQCNEPPTEGDVERWVMGYVPDSMNCSGAEAPDSWANQVIWGPDCSDNSLVDQLVAGCNPFNPASNPDSPFPNSCLPEPDTDEPLDWVNHTRDWVTGQALWLVLTTLPPWLVSVLFGVIGELPGAP